MSENSKALLIPGMHRSGTSVAARLCNILGADIGNNLLKAEKDNAKGFWEHEDIVEIHEHLLAGLLTSWDDIRGFQNNEWLNSEKSSACAREITHILKRDFSGKDLWMVKDPRLSLLAPMWQNILQKNNADPHYMIIQRDPGSVIKSLENRDKFTPEKSLLLWCLYSLQAEKNTRGQKRCIVTFDALLKDWRMAMEYAGKELGITWPHSFNDIAHNVEKFIDPDLVHSKKAEINVDNKQLKEWAIAINEAIPQNIGGEIQSNILDEIAKDIHSFRDKDKNLYFTWIEEAIGLRNLYSSKTNENNILQKKISDLKKHNDEQKKYIENADIEILKTHSHLNQTHAHLQAILNSRAWKITAPYRISGTFCKQASRLMLQPHNYRKAYSILRHEGISGLYWRMKKVAMADAGNNEYDKWVAEYDTISPSDRTEITSNIKTMDYKPLISVVMPVYNVEEKWLRQAIESVQNQLYPHWQLCIADDCSPSPHIRKILEEYQAKDERIKVIFREKNGHISESSNSALELVDGEFVALMDHDDILPEHALYYIACELDAHPDTDLIYSDEDKIDEDGKRYGAYFKPDWNLDLLYGQNYFSHLGVYRTSLLQKIGGFRKGVEGSQDYDLVLRCLAHIAGDKIRHIPRVLYHWRAIEGSTALSNDAKDYAQPSSEKALEEYFSSTKIEAEIAPHNHYLLRRIIWKLPARAPKASILISTGTNLDLLRVTIESIHKNTEYPDYEIVVISSDEENKQTLRYLSEAGNSTTKIIECATKSASEQYMKGVEHSAGEVICFIEAGVEITDDGWLKEMVSQAMRPDIGAVGAAIYHHSSKMNIGTALFVQNDGNDMAIEPLFPYCHNKDHGYFGRAALTQRVSAVSSQCMAIQKDLFVESGGFNIKNLPNAHFDVDLCLRLRQNNYHSLYTPFATMTFHGKNNKPQYRYEKLFIKQKWGGECVYDTTYNLNLAPGTFSLIEK